MLFGPHNQINMAKFKCACGEIRTVRNTTIKVVDGKIVTPESYCEKCKQYGEYIREHTGFGGIIKRKGGKVGKL